MLKRILVTGGAGFIGSHTVDLLLSRGYHVTVLDNLSSGKLTNLNLTHPQLDLIEGDVLNYEVIKKAVAQADAVLHLAAIASVPQSIAEPIYTFQVNLQGFLHVMQAIKQAHRPIRLVYASSAAVYGNTDALPCSEETPLTRKVFSPYALQKMNDEDYAALYAELDGLPSLGLRYFNVYGQRQDPASPYSGVISRFLEAYSADAELTVFGDGYQSRDFIFVEDVALANTLALESDYHGVLNIATEKAQTLLQLIAYLEAVGNKKAKIMFKPARPGDIRLSYGATSKAKQHIGFHYTISLREGIKKMYDEDLFGINRNW